MRGEEFLSDSNRRDTTVDWKRGRRKKKSYTAGQSGGGRLYGELKMVLEYRMTEAV